MIERQQHDGTVLRLRKLHADYDPRDRVAAMTHVQAMQARGEVVTGLLYVDPSAGDLHDALNTSPLPLNAMDEAALCPGAAALRSSTPACAESSAESQPRDLRCEVSVRLQTRALALLLSASRPPARWPPATGARRRPSA